MTNQQQQQTEYDNTNKGSLFIPRSEKAPCNLSGSANVNGDTFYADYFKTDGSRCAAVLVLKDEHQEPMFVIPLFKSSKGGKAVMYGKFKLDPSRSDAQWYVNVIEKERRSSSSPVLGLYFSPPRDGATEQHKTATDTVVGLSATSHTVTDW